jgi:hypothetical protein
MINASWCVLETTFIIWYCVETSTQTLGEIDECIDMEYHSDALLLMGVMKERVDVEVKNAQFPNGGDHAGNLFGYSCLEKGQDRPDSSNKAISAKAIPHHMGGC